MQNIIIAGILIIIIGLAVRYIYKSKKNGKKCIGCPYGGSCGSNKNESCSCGNKK